MDGCDRSGVDAFLPARAKPKPGRSVDDRPGGVEKAVAGKVREAKAKPKRKTKAKLRRKAG